jgi:hypothetical protein
LLCYISCFYHCSPINVKCYRADFLKTQN